MFNYFSELKSKIKNINLIDNSEQCVFIGGKLLYVEGYKGLLTMTENNIVFKISQGVINVEGETMVIKELTADTILITGKITKLERV